MSQTNVQYALLVQQPYPSFPKELHPMTQLGMAVAALNHDSTFQAAYEKGIKKSEYWTYTFEDCINLLARLPTLAARIYRNIYKPGKELTPIDRNLDLVGTQFHSQLLTGSNSRYRQLLKYAWIRGQSQSHRIPAPLYCFAR